jgi:DNA helicase-2/ATP-dependent DNA helicase PcrA
MTYASRRTLWGNVQLNQPSRFLREIPEELFRNGRPARVSAKQSSVVSRQSSAGPTKWRPTTHDSRLTTDDSQGSSLRDLDVQGLVNNLKTRQAGRFRSGERVRHPTLGDGIVVKSSGTGDQEQVSVLFAGHGEKKFLASLARLDKCP